MWKAPEPISWMRSSSSAGISLGPRMCLLKAFSAFVKSEASICLCSVLAASRAAKSFLKLLSVLGIIQLKAAVREPSVISHYCS